MTHLNVAVRVRPLSDREIEQQSIPIVEIYNGHVIAVTNLKVPEQNAGDSRERIRRFSFDYCFDASSTQEQVFEVVEDVIGNAIRNKYHSCVLAYGQSSSGKTHTIMGLNDDPGLTPRLCEKIFSYISEADVEADEKKVTVSYLEVYNEKVKDLLRPDESEACRENQLRVREHPSRGTYVQGLTQHHVEDSDELVSWLQTGNKRRRVSATSINPQSSRSHSVVTITCFGGVKLNLVDLAGSERTGSRSFNNSSTFREGANINKSLVALGNVIFALADQSSRNSKSFRKRYVPYRDSVLTWLLKDTLGGNSKTVMIATISPSSTSYNETVNTLRFGHRAKQIISQPVVNEDPKQKIIRDLRTEIARLKELLVKHQITPLLTYSQQQNVKEDSKPMKHEKLFTLGDSGGELKIDNISSDTILPETFDRWTTTEEHFFVNEDPYFESYNKDFIFDQIRSKFKENNSNQSNEGYLHGIQVEHFLEAFKRIFSTNLIRTNYKTFNADETSLQSDKFNVPDEKNHLLPQVTISDNNIAETCKNINFRNSGCTQIYNIQNSIPELKIFVCPSNNITKAEDSETNKNTITTAQSAVHNKSIINDDPSYNQRVDSASLYLKTEKLIPVMDVTSILSNPKKPVVKLRRTFSVSSADMEDKKSKLYGSYDALTTKSENGSKSQSTQLRKRSLDKSTSSVKGLTLRREKSSIGNVSEKVKSERGMVTEIKGLSKVEAKVDSIRKTPIKPRSEIVAAVTQRLYGKVKKKEAATETDDIIREHKSTLARIRLQDITQRALRAYRRKHTETQTDSSPILRVKEISTDVNDLKVDLLETKNANVCTDEIITKHIAISCNFLDNFQNFDSRRTLILTKSCGTQVNNDEKSQKDVSLKSSQNIPTNNLLSFTKYLRSEREPKFQIANHGTANPIYTSSVNINVSHNYVNGNKTDSLSGDSLEEQNLQAVGLPTPDLISNHSSLEQHLQENDEVPTTNETIGEDVNYALASDISEQFTTNREFLSKKTIIPCSAKCYVIPKHQARIESINIPGTFVPEMCIQKDNTTEQCISFDNCNLKMCKLKITENVVPYDGPVCLEEASILKSIMKQNRSLDEKFESDSDSSNMSFHTFENVPDSLNYHFTKSVRFNEERVSDRIFESMTNFLKEATSLMTNLNIAASKLEKDSNHSFDLQVTVNGANELINQSSRQRRRPRRRARRVQSSCQTSNNHENVSSQTSPKKTIEKSVETDADIPENKYEHLVEAACNRLEQCTNSVCKKQFGEKSNLQKCPQPFTISSDWPADYSVMQLEDSSLESNITFSDYGSLPRQKIKHRSGYSPRAYLRELTSMRKQIIDSSREELSNDTHYAAD